MFAGHIGAGLALARSERRINPAWFVFAALLLDAALWLLVLARVEAVAIPADFPLRHQPDFRFPWSHGLAGAICWSLSAAAVAWLAGGRLGRARGRAAGLVGLAVFSHWLLDALVHQPELPLLGDSSMALGLGLWDRMPTALAVEAALAIGGLALWLGGSGLPKGRRRAAIGLQLLTLVFTIAGMTIAPAPPSVQAMAGSSLATLLLLCALFARIGRRAVPGAQDGIQEG
jgi:membrane-bound metal-dependent hydrolase YbcI (DUF457 family)